MKFVKNTFDDYLIPINFKNELVNGESIKSISLSIRDKIIDSSFEQRFLDYQNDVNNNIPNAYDNIIIKDFYVRDKIYVMVETNGGIEEETYPLNVTVKTNKSRSITKTIDIEIDVDSYPSEVQSLNYKYIVDDYSLYIVPELKTPFSYDREIYVKIINNLPSENGLSLMENYNFWFTTKYCPLFTTAQSVKMILGPEGDRFEDDTINRYIHRNSVEIVDVIKMFDSSIEYTSFGCDDKNIPYILKRYVECKSAYDMRNLLDRLSSIDGNQTKKLGDMSVTYGGLSNQNVGSKVDPKKELFDCFDGIYRLLSNGVKTGVRGLYDMSKGYNHPVMDAAHSRVNKPLPTSSGPWRKTKNELF